MLTEYSADPRRANWLTLGGSPDDFAWPDTRPASELEAEILRLTTRLMMRERELRQARAAAGRAQAQASTWRRRTEAKEAQVRALLERKDSEMRNIVSQLLLFEAELRQEQRRIEGLLARKDALIAAQQEEMARLRDQRDDSAPGRKTSPSNQFTERDSDLWLQERNDSTSGWKKNPSNQFLERDFDRSREERNDSTPGGKKNPSSQWDFRIMPDSRKDTADSDSPSWRTKEFVSSLSGGLRGSPLKNPPEEQLLNTKEDTVDAEDSSWMMEYSQPHTIHGKYQWNDSAPDPALGRKTNLWSQFPERDFRNMPDSRKDTADKDYSSWRTEGLNSNLSDDWKGSPLRNPPEEQLLNTKEDTADVELSSWMIKDSSPHSVHVKYHNLNDWEVNPSSHPHENDFKTPSPRQESSESDHSTKSGMEDSISDLIQVAYPGEKNPSRHSPERDSRKTPDLKKETSDKDRHSLRMEDSFPESVHAGYHAMNDWKTKPSSHSPERDSSKMQVSGKNCADRDHPSWGIEDSADVGCYAMENSTRKPGQGSHLLEKESLTTHEPREDVADRNHSPRMIEDFAEMPAVDAVRKLKDGLTKIRAIQDVTNVASLGSSCDIPPVEKKKVPSRPPQKMKDLKAKRMNHHKVHRNVVNEICGQAIL